MDGDGTIGCGAGMPEGVLTSAMAGPACSTGTASSAMDGDVSSAGASAAGTVGSTVACSVEASSTRGGVICSPISIDGFEVYSGAGSASAAGVCSGSAARDGCSAATGVAGVGGISLTASGSIVDSGDAVTTPPPANGEGAMGSAASAAASLAGLSAIGLGVVPSPFPEGGDSKAVATCLNDGGLEEPLMEAVSESRSRSEGLGDPERIPGMLNAVEERFTAVPTLPQRDFLEGGDAEIEPVDVVDIVEIDDSPGSQISGTESRAEMMIIVLWLSE